MPALSTVRAANAALFSSSTARAKTAPVALFVGGTSGIGQAMAELFARTAADNNVDAQILICGRNRAAAESIFASFPTPSSGQPLRHEFIPCDVTLMKNVRATTASLLERLPKLNYLVLTPGILTMRGRDETEEGIDKKLALHYYARWRFIYDLIPLLQKARDAGEDAKTITVLAAGQGAAIDLDDLGLKKHYSLFNAGLSAPTYNDLMIDEFALRHPDIAFTHAGPGAVRTPLLKVSHWALKPLVPIIYGLTYPISVAPEECAEYMLFALLNGEKGAYRRGSKGDDIGQKRYFGSDEERTKLWEHTVEATS